MELTRLLSTPIANSLNRKSDGAMPLRTESLPHPQPSSRWRLPMVLLLISAAALLAIVELRCL
jgi:hypothetical protein